MAQKPLPAYQGDEPYLFVSYSHADDALVLPEIRWLQDLGFHVWWDEGISPGAEWRDEVAQALANASLILYFVSPNAVRSQQCTREINYGLDRFHRPVLAVHLVETELPDALGLVLSDRQALIRYQLEPDDYGRKLVSALATYLERPMPVIESSPPLARHRRSNRWLLETALMFLLGVGVAAAVAWYTPFPNRSGERDIAKPLRASLFTTAPIERANTMARLAISPDGGTLAFLGGQSRMLWLQDLRDGSARPIAGTEGARDLSWSPDGKHLAFMTNNELRRIDATGGALQTICDTLADPRGADWGADDFVLLSDSSGPILRVRATGGRPVAVTRPDEAQKEKAHAWPTLLPDGDHFLFVALLSSRAPLMDDRGAVYVASRTTGERTFLFNARSPVVYTEPGYLLFLRNGTLMAQAFNAARLELVGESMPVAEGIRRYVPTSSAAFDVSPDLLVYLSGADTSELVWLDRNGRRLESAWSPGQYDGPRLSHDGQRVALSVMNGLGEQDIWVYDLARGVPTQLSFEPGDETNPVWSPDDRQIVYSSWRRGQFDLYLKSIDGAPEAEPLLESDEVKFANDWSRDGRNLLMSYFYFGSGTGWDLWGLSVAERKPFPVFEGPFTQFAGALSPDGRWVAYHSTTPAGSEVFVRAFPGPGEQWQVSSRGGRHAHWRQDGRELYYVSEDGMLMAVDVGDAETGGLELGSPKALFAVPIDPRLATTNYDVAGNGDRFLVNRPTSDVNAHRMEIIQNWRALLPQ